MSDDVDLRIAALLSSHLCHEIASPLGAVINGFELLHDVGGDMEDEAMEIIESSARRAAARVTFYRKAYGAAGIEGVGDAAVARELLDALMEEGKVKLDWTSVDEKAPLPHGWGRLLMNMVVVAAETLPRGGRLQIAFERGTEGGLLAVTARGEPAVLREENRRAFQLDCPVDALEARNVHDHFTSRLAASLGSGLDIVEEGSNEIQFMVRLGAGK